MKKVLFRNITNHIQYPGGKAVRPNDSRMVDECYCPQTEPKPEMFNLETFIELSVDDSVKQLGDLSDEHLVMVVEAEQSKSRPRITLLNAIGDELDDRAAEDAKGKVLAELEELDDSELQEILMDDENEDNYKALVQSILDARLTAEPDGDENNQP